MILRLQVNDDGEWGTLNTRQSTNSEEDIAKMRAELSALQSTWSSNYARYKDARFRITEEK